MSNSYSSPTFDDEDEYPKITQSDLDRAEFRVGLKPAPRKRRVTILLDTVLIEYFRAKAGERGYQTLINDTLRQAIEREELEDALRRIIREELDNTPSVAV
jgi:uncharacterized protein (DUF4415 family)